MDDNKRHAISPVRNKNMGVDAMGEPWVPPNSGHNDLMENMKAFNNVYSKIHTNSTGHSCQDILYQSREEAGGVNQVKSSSSHYDGYLSYGMNSTQDIDVEQTSTVTDRRYLKSKSRQTVNVLEIASSECTLSNCSIKMHMKQLHQKSR